MTRANKLVTLVSTLFENDHESSVPDVSSWKKIGAARGSNPGGEFQDKNGNHHYVKHSKSDEHARAEVLYSHMLRHMRVPVLKHELVRHQGKLAVASAMQKLEPYNNRDHEQNKQVAGHLAAHALIANWDMIGNMGQGGDNYSKDSSGHMVHLDTGGAGKYRAQGGLKGSAFGKSADEFDSIRNPKLNPKNAHVFDHMEPKDLVDSVRNTVAKFKNSDIHNLVKKHGPVDPEEKRELTTKIIARKRDLISRANVLANKHGLEPVKDTDD